MPKQDQAQGQQPAGSPWQAFGTPGAVPPVAPLAVPPAPLLRLQEVWRAEVVGGQITRAGLDGSVGWVPELAAAQVPAVCFSLMPAGGAAGALQQAGAVASALSNARAHPQSTRPGRHPGAAALLKSMAAAAGASAPAPAADDDKGWFTADVASAKQLLAPALVRCAGIPAQNGCSSSLFMFV